MAKTRTVTPPVKIVRVQAAAAAAPKPARSSSTALANLRRLLYLNLTDNHLASLPDWLGRLTGLVADLETLARAQETPTLQRAPVDLLALAGAAAQNFEAAAAQKGLTLAVQGQSSTVPADRERLAQVLAGLLSNALRYTPRGGHV